MVRAGPAAVVGAGPAVVGGGVVSGGWAEEDAAWGRWRVARGDPVLGAWAVGRNLRNMGLIPGLRKDPIHITTLQ